MGILWARSGPGMTAEIESIKLATSKRGKLDLKSVPLDQDLTVTVRYVAIFPEGGEGELVVRLVDGEGNEILSDDEECKSKGGTQKYQGKYFMNETLAGEDMEIMVTLTVEAGQSKIEDKDSLAYVVEEGEDGTDGSRRGDAELEAARQKAAARFEEAMNAVNGLVAEGINESGLPEMLEKAAFLVQNATNMEQLVGESDSAMFYANYVINECNNRRNIAAQQRAAQQDIADCQSVMLSYARNNSANLTDFYLQGFSINDARTAATATVVATLASGGDYPGQKTSTGIRAEKQGGQWVVTYFGTA